MRYHNVVDVTAGLCLYGLLYGYMIRILERNKKRGTTKPVTASSYLGWTSRASINCINCCAVTRLLYCRSQNQKIKREFILTSYEHKLYNRFQYVTIIIAG